MGWIKFINSKAKDSWGNIYTVLMARNDEICESLMLKPIIYSEMVLKMLKLTMCDDNSDNIQAVLKWLIYTMQGYQIVNKRTIVYS